MLRVVGVDPMSDGTRRSDLVIGGLIGGTAAALVASVIIIVIVRLCRQWRQYQKAVQRALDELQSNSPDGAAITPAAARRESLLGTFFTVLHPVIFLPRDATLARYMPQSCVCLSVCLSEVGVLLKRLNVGSRKQRRATQSRTV